MALADNVVFFPGVTEKEYDASIMLEGDLRAGLDSVIIIGWDKEGELFFSSSYAAGPEVLWLIELAKKRLLQIGDGE